MPTKKTSAKKGAAVKSAKKPVKVAIKKSAPAKKLVPKAKVTAKKGATTRPVAKAKEQIIIPAIKTASIVAPALLSGEMDKTYIPVITEDAVQKIWDAAKVGVADGKGRETFTMMMPPPNVTGALHLGHAITLTLEDTLARYKRMRGYDVLWLPGTDHAGIATQNVVERHLGSQGLDRHVLGREEFVKKVWSWKDVYHKRITEQVKKIGASCDWSRERFTLDDGLSSGVTHAFVQLHKKGLIYRDKRLVNWCPRCTTVLSDIEVDHREEDGNLYFVRYFVNATDRSICVATTRPETMLGDVAVAVHPDDPRYSEFIGKKVILPITNRLIPVIADKRVDPKFGTGAVKITPAHDPLDAAIGRDHKLESIVVIGPNGKMTKHAGRFRGMSIPEARNNIIRYLDDIGNLEKIVKHKHNVGHCSRCSAVIEPLEGLQWFVKMQPLAEKAIKAVKKKEVTFVPERFEKEFLSWLENIQDWCISRQLWWGHQIPVWYCKKVAEWPKGSKKKGEGCGQPIVAEHAPAACPHCGNLALVRDPDVLDTWFSSGLWPFSTLGWPNKTPDLKRYYPNTILETGRDIIFFWVARMVTLGLELTGEVPFKTVYLHGLVLDEHGKKMSKSSGNGIDPLEMAEKFGADALRLSLTVGAAPGVDLRFSETKIAGQRNFINKLWNASRFVASKLKNNEIPHDPVPHSLPDRWILSRLNSLIAEVTVSLEKYAFGEAATKIQDFVWYEFCDWYLELTKETPNTAVLAHTIAQILRLAHPCIPFVTESIWSHLFGGKKVSLLTQQKWPTAISAKINPKIEADMRVMLSVISVIRSIRNEMGVEPGKKISAVVYSVEKFETLQKNANEVKKLAHLSSLKIAKQGKKIENAVAKFENGIEIYLPLSQLLDPREEKRRLNGELVDIEQYRVLIATRLDNKDFVARAPVNVVSAERTKLAEAEDKITKIRERLALLGK